jgi:PAS domain S-box-containing protein
LLKDDWMHDGVDPASPEARSPQLRVGWFRFFFDDQRWEWSAEVQRMHGYEPGEITPTTDLVLSHKHPDDRDRVAALLEEIRTTHQPFNTRHRIIDARGSVHDVAVVGHPLTNDGHVIGTQGFYVDVTPGVAMRQQTISAAVAEIAENRSAIEQAKGMLMLIYRLDADRAFDLLKWRSQETNTRLRNLAVQLTADFLALDFDDTLPTRAEFDEVLLTAHLRITDTG